MGLALQGRVVGQVATLGGVLASNVAVETAFVGAVIARGTVRNAVQTVIFSSAPERVLVVVRVGQGHGRRETLASR